jgi:hypothetical protein
MPPANWAKVLYLMQAFANLIAASNEIFLGFDL